MIITIDGNLPSKKAHSFNIMKMAQGFLENGENVTLVTLNSWPLIKNGIKVKDIYDYYAVSSKINIKRITPLNFDFFRKTIGAKNYNQKAVSYIRKQKPEFVYARGYLTPYFSALQGLKVIAEIHSVKYDHPDLKKLFSVADKENFLGFVTIHQAIKDEYIKRGIPADKILVLEDGVDFDKFQIDDDKNFHRKDLRLNKDKKLIVYAGSLYREKGIEDILKTAAILQSENNVEFILVGGSDLEIQEWKTYCQNNAISNVKFTGFKSNSLIPKYLKSADVLIMPYSMKIDYKAMDINTTSPLKLFEYMATKRPIITTDIPVVSKILKHNESAILCEADNIKQLAANVLDLINNQEKSQMLSDNVFSLSEKYSWKNRCKTIKDYFSV